MDRGASSGWSRECDDVLTNATNFVQKLLGKPVAALEAAPPPVEPPPKKPTLDLRKLNPSLFVVGLETVEALMTRYLAKAGLACEKMQHAGLPVEVIRTVLLAIFGVERTPEQIYLVFSLFDASGDGYLDEDEFLAVLPLLGEDAPPEVIDKLYQVVDDNETGTIDGQEFDEFIRGCNPSDPEAAEGWRAFLPEHEAHAEEMVLINVIKPGGGEGKDARWRPVAFHEVALLQRSAESAWSTSLLLAKADLANAESIIDGLKELGMRDDEVLVVTRALFVTESDADYAKVFKVFDTDGTGGIDPFEFRAIVALLGNHLSEVEARELFLESDLDNNGVLDVGEFTALIKRMSPKARAASDLHHVRDLMARERLQERIATVASNDVDPATAEATLKLLVLGPSRAGKTYLLNQVLSEKLAKGKTVSVGVGALGVRIGTSNVAVQMLDAPGDERFAPLARLFYRDVAYALLVFDATSIASFEALPALAEAFAAAHPERDPGACMCVVSNLARIGVQRAVSSGYAQDWCHRAGNLPYYEIDPDRPQGLLEPIRQAVDEHLSGDMLRPYASAEAGYDEEGMGDGSELSEEMRREAARTAAARAAADALGGGGDSFGGSDSFGAGRRNTADRQMAHIVRVSMQSAYSQQVESRTAAARGEPGSMRRARESVQERKRQAAGATAGPAHRASVAEGAGWDALTPGADLPWQSAEAEAEAEARAARASAFSSYVLDEEEDSWRSSDDGQPAAASAAAPPRKGASLDERLKATGAPEAGTRLSRRSGGRLSRAEADRPSAAPPPSLGAMQPSAKVSSKTLRVCGTQGLSGSAPARSSLRKPRFADES